MTNDIAAGGRNICDETAELTLIKYKVMENGSRLTNLTI